MDKAFSFGNKTILARFSTGFGLYIETIPPQLRPALAYDEEDDEMYTTFIEYSATCIKLPFFQIEIGKFRQLEEGELDVTNLFPGVFEEYEEEDDDEDSPTMH